MYVMSLDCEFNQPSRKIIEVGAAIYNPRNAALIERFHSYVNPGEPIDPYITDLTGITNENVSGAPTIQEVYRELGKFHKKHRCFINPLVWGSGVRNDSLALWEESGFTEDNFMGFRVLDVKTIYQSMRIFDGKEIKSGLSNSMKRVGLEFEGTPHRALPDAMNTFMLWYHLMRIFHDGSKANAKR